eukprot:TRINITY_DN6357_c0_g1_i1.p1 TRINITY_DN6357_c0_g1~~TRINITY_DN6357_c0_g1_i1.p1  ORF type:complete len:432 (+),score=105.25 TRINITY_DN6357_c0_g1_i1:146-1441(+)
MDSNRAQNLEIEEEYQKRYQRSILLKVFVLFFILLFIILERIFDDYIQSIELDWILSLQKALEFKAKGSSLMRIFAYVTPYKYSFILITHFYFTLFFGYDAIFALKLLYMHMIGAYVVVILELLYQDPRPFWVDENVVTSVCSNTFAEPAFSVFNILFIVYYYDHIWRTVNEDMERPWWYYVVHALFALLMIGFGFSLFLNGQNFINQMLTSVFFFILFYFVLRALDEKIDQLIMKSTVQVEQSKAYVFYWLLGILLAVVVGSIIYEASDTFVDISWIINYVNCKKDIESLDSEAQYLLGPWFSFTKFSLMILLLGAVFGAARTFRDMQNVFWYRTSWQKRLARVAIANALIGISWLISWSEDNITGKFSSAGLNEFLYLSIHFFLVYYIGFGYLPKYVFQKLNLVNTDLTYSVPPEFSDTDNLTKLYQFE